MRIRLTPALIMASCLGLAAPLALTAQKSASHGADASIGVRGSTLGIGVEVSKLLTSHIGIRVGGNTLKVTRSEKSSDVTFDAQLKMRSFSALIDLYPSPRGSLHFTGGLVTKPFELTATGTPSASGTFKLNGTEYNSSQVGTLSASGEYASMLPYVGLGFGTPANTKGALKLVFDVGMLVGKSTIALHATGAAAGSALYNDVQAQLAKTQSDVNKWLPVYPVVSLGLVVRF